MHLLRDPVVIYGRNYAVRPSFSADFTWWNRLWRPLLRDLTGRDRTEIGGNYSLELSSIFKNFESRLSVKIRGRKFRVLAHP